MIWGVIFTRSHLWWELIAFVEFDSSHMALSLYTRGVGMKNLVENYY
jgi:hypothetical protein